jgi:predicted membrane chloride channel (bestrophin family)
MMQTAPKEFQVPEEDDYRQMLMQQVATAAAAGAPLTQQQQTDTWTAMLKQRQDRLDEVMMKQTEIAQSLYDVSRVEYC